MSLQILTSSTSRRQPVTDEIARARRERKYGARSQVRAANVDDKGRKETSSTPSSSRTLILSSGSIAPPRSGPTEGTRVIQLLDSIMTSMSSITEVLEEVENAYRLRLLIPVGGQRSLKSKLNLTDVKAFNQWDRLEYDPHLQHRLFLDRFRTKGINEIEIAINSRKGTQTGLSARHLGCLSQAIADTANLSQSISGNLPDGREHPASKYGSVESTKLILIEQRLWKAWTSIVHILNHEEALAKTSNRVPARRTSSVGSSASSSLAGEMFRK